jgi:hypothetical protein
VGQARLCAAFAIARVYWRGGPVDCGKIALGDVLNWALRIIVPISTAIMKVKLIRAANASAYALLGGLVFWTPKIAASYGIALILRLPRENAADLSNSAILGSSKAESAVFL